MENRHQAANGMMAKMANKPLHRTAIPLRSIPAGYPNVRQDEINIITSFAEIAKAGKSGK